MRTVATAAADLFAPGHRLDASYHASPGVRTQFHIERWAASGLRNARRLDLLANVCRKGGIFIPARFKRVYVSNADHGVPYLTGSSILQANPLDGGKLLSRRYTTNQSRLALHERMILVTCSGIIGNSVYVNGNFADTVGSPDLLRIVADEDRIPPGYLFAFLSSPEGRALIEQKTYGAVVPHIEAHHVLDLSIPRLDPAVEQRIHNLIEQAAQLRVEAINLRAQVSFALSKSLKLDLNENQFRKVAVIPRAKLERRFEGGYYTASQFVAKCFEGKSVDLAFIGDLISNIFYLGKLHRVFVDKREQGVPLLSIADALKARITTDKYISSTLSRNVRQAQLEQDWILVSRTGTPGLATYVRREMVGMAGTDHLVRLIVDRSMALPGYLYGILASKFGFTLLNSAVHGSVQPQLPPEYIKKLRVPLLSLEEQKVIHEMVVEHAERLSLASEAEDTAQALLAEALELDA